MKTEISKSLKRRPLALSHVQFTAAYTTYPSESRRTCSFSAFFSSFSLFCAPTPNVGQLVSIQTLKNTAHEVLISVNSLLCGDLASFPKWWPISRHRQKHTPPVLRPSPPSPPPTSGCRTCCVPPPSSDLRLPHLLCSNPNGKMSLFEQAVCAQHCLPSCAGFEIRLCTPVVNRVGQSH